MRENFLMTLFITTLVVNPVFTGTVVTLTVLALNNNTETSKETEQEKCGHAETVVISGDKLKLWVCGCLTFPCADPREQMARQGQSP
ncbi:hypothetical protein [Undibacterium sp. TJN19]|uniref:hypothetical protein n=1 Tax=Undibacterium sp. TJN19 TaxID=3413055 RepID=UPI003BF0268B